MRQVWSAVARRLLRHWQRGWDTPFVVTYTMVVLAGLALFGLQAAVWTGALTVADSSFAVVLLTILLLIVLTLQARALDRVRRAHARVRTQGVQLRRSLDELLVDNRLRHARIEELSIIRELGLAINSILDFNRLLATSAKLIADTVEATGYILFLRDRTGEFTCPLAVRRGEQLAADDPFVTRFRDRHLAPTLAASGALLADDDDCGRFFLVPLADTEQHLGLLGLYEPRRLPFGHDQLGLLSQLGKHLALALKNALLYDLAITDGLTGLYVHRHFQHRLQQELATAQRYGRPLALVMCDIDHFKKFNDTYGHQIGDDVLRAVAQTLRATLRAADSAYRYGGEEMCAILPETESGQALQVAERLRAAIAALRLPTDKGPVQVTSSFGVAVWLPAYGDKDGLIKAADSALYAAKEAGRNCVRGADTAPAPAADPAPAAAPGPDTPPRPRIIRPAPTA